MIAVLVVGALTGCPPTPAANRAATARAQGSDDAEVERKGFDWGRFRGQDATTVLQRFNKIDDEQVGAFFKCVVRVKHVAIHKADSILVLTDGLENAFKNFPRGQPGWIRDKCVPLLDAALKDLGRLRPAALATPLESYKGSLRGARASFQKYAAAIEKRKDEAARELTVRQMAADFHGESSTSLAIEYSNLLLCAVPDLLRLVKAIKQPPDSQPVVEYIYNTCKADPRYADTLRTRCFAARKNNQKKTADVRLLAQQISGDPRDLEAINDCFRRANASFASKEIKAVGEAFVAYVDARGKVREQKPAKDGP
jgi:hypothetical protein